MHFANVCHDVFLKFGFVMFFQKIVEESEKRNFSHNVDGFYWKIIAIRTPV